eukprot:TRINITY_DN4540_c1_g1_i2.p1 TRINITY_DN4540_c1_g1~~TRINITY_DN4540_c1_g1_i2.p1  ORF type:complete len:760 (+),score=280.53 TRINITY_DN4540_c1_g1_i2:125-2404(+)
MEGDKQKTKQPKVQPAWHAPASSPYFKGLQLNNSLTSTKVDFVPQNGNQVVYYVCGPTVYDQSHLGHARNYVAFDIVRRVLELYFNYEVFAVLNITDVDDKIILKARRRHLFDTYLAKQTTLTDEVRGDLITSWSTFLAGLEAKLAKVEADKDKDPEEKAAETKLLNEKIQVASGHLDAIKNLEKESTDPAAKHLEPARDPLGELLDSRSGHTISDHQIFKEVSQQYESEFWADMDALGIKRPHVVTRVTEYVPEIVAYIEKIIANGFAYAVNGSVYFDTGAFQKDHAYAKLAPNSAGNKALLDEGEGSLQAKDTKKNDGDFALWKKSKPGEPFWESPWGQGRPGWHIECSAMASAFADVIDIHGGGSDLKFPHHDNELAQSEGYFNCQQWVNYFLHSGHLKIEGLKMSKSLKNFITIRQALEDFSPRQLRMLFLLKPWDRELTYTKTGMKEITTKEKTISEFFLNFQNISRNSGDSASVVQKWTEQERSLHANLSTAQNDVDTHLKNNVDTVNAVEAILKLINQTNKYLAGTEKPQILLLRQIAAFITRILRIFGVIDDSALGFETGGGDRKTLEEEIKPIVDTFLEYRKEIRSAARSKAEPLEFLKLSDKIRDQTLPKVGFKLRDDVKTDGSTWILVDPKEIEREIRQKEADERAAKIAKLKLTYDKLKVDIQKMEDGRVAPADKWPDLKKGADGIPTHDADGKEISKSASKGYKKDLESHKKLHESYQKRLAQDPTFLEKLKKDAAAMQATIEGSN